MHKYDIYSEKYTFRIVFLLVRLFYSSHIKLADKAI